MNITFRDALIEEATLLSQKEKEIAEVPGLFCSSPTELTVQNVEDTIRKFHESQKGIYLVAEYDQKVVAHGFLKPLGVQSISHVAQLNIAVHPGWQKKGIGRKLMEALIERAKRADYLEKIELNVRATNHHAISLYKKLGFVEEGRQKNRVKIGDNYIDDIIMALFVTPYSKPAATRAQKADTFSIIPATQDELQILDQSLTEYNVHVAKELPEAVIERLDFSIKNQAGEFLGGIEAKRINWGILHVELLYVFEKYRHHGLASKLLNYVETIAKEHQCHVSHLSTFDFQAKDFYLKHGYSVFGTLYDVPKGHERYYMKKDLI